MIKKKILIATGGSGGHIFPGYSLTNYYKKKQINVKLTTDKRGLRYLKNYKNLYLVIIPSSPFIKKNIFKFFFLFLFFFNYQIFVIFTV